MINDQRSTNTQIFLDSCTTTIASTTKIYIA
ncbi:MAG: hypothetical protein Homavirus21_7 [Homavirus sp.]|uniref:Uncharacterized protein n=1 Tax=Homavirus sp. TaxID=2487769 RepID=A0A3G5A4V3_9VIRU|nr:MAG: hypothetical protein Homavirus21_7 [Homavirus sp.]